MAKKKPTRRKPARSKSSAVPGSSARRQKWIVERVQTGVRIEKRLVKVLKGLAEYLDITLGDLLEAIVLHAFDGKCAFTNPETLQTIAKLKRIYKLDLDSRAGHHMMERDDG